MPTNPTQELWSALRHAARTIVVVDVVESVRLIEQHEFDVIERWRRFVNEVVTEVLAPGGGRLVKSLGDGMLLEFSEVLPAVRASLEMQKRIGAYNAGREAADALQLRIGMHAADVVVDEIDVYGSGVNLASRLTTLAGPGEIVVSPQIRDQLVPDLDAAVEDLGECYLKHIAKPVRAYRVGAAGEHSVLPAGDRDAAVLQPTVAVIPFAGRGTLERPDVLGELIADGVIGRLSTTAELRVISRLSSSVFACRAIDPQAVAAHLDTQYVLSGSHHALGERIIVSAELADARNSTVVWADRLSTSLADLMQVDSELIGRIAEASHQAILRAEVRRSRTRPLPTLESFSLLLGAVSLMHRQSNADFARSREMLEHLSERHPRHATPKAWLAKWYAVCAAQGWSANAESDAVVARSIVGRALASEPGNALAWTIKGLLHGYVDKNFDDAESAYLEALRNNPNEPLAWLFLGSLNGWRGNGPVARDAAERALRLSPLDPLRYYFDSLAAAAMLGAHDYARAIELAERSLRSNRAHLATFKVLVLAQTLAGDMEGAAHTARELRARAPAFSVEHFLSHSPWRVSPEASTFAAALREAGVPQS